MTRFLTRFWPWSEIERLRGANSEVTSRWIRECDKLRGENLRLTFEVALLESASAEDQGYGALTIKEFSRRYMLPVVLQEENDELRAEIARLKASVTP